MSNVNKHFHDIDSNNNLDISLLANDNDGVLIDGNVWINLNDYTGITFYYYKNNIMHTVANFPLPSV